MFIKKSSVDEIAEGLEENIKLAYNAEEDLIKSNVKSVVACLALASDLLDQVGLSKESMAVSIILKKIAEEKDPSAPASSEKALSNLEHKGWMFNADDDDDIDREEDAVEID
jgi:hypothetical protein